jgi:hypothetical protein
MVLEQLRRLCGNELSQREEQGVIDWHHRHFRRRAERLDPSFFPGQEKNADSIASLGGGAYAWFKDGELRDGRGAFRIAVDQSHDPPTGFLYYWRGSATVTFLLREETSGRLAFRRKRQRNLRLALRKGFRSSTHGGETRWSLPEWPEGGPPAATVDAMPVEQIRVEAETLRGAALVRAILEAAGRPLTQAEIAAVDEQSLGLADERPDRDPDRRPLSSNGADPELATMRRDLEPRLRALYEGLDELTRRVLVARRFAEPDAPLPSFRAIAGFVGKGHETCRKIELRFRAAMQRLVEKSEQRLATEILVELIRTDPLTAEFEAAHPPRAISNPENRSGS